MTYCIQIPELNLSRLEINNLKEIFYQNKEKYGHKYISESGNDSGLILVGGFLKPKLIEKIENKINSNFIDASYFLSNYGVERHIDDNRQCIFSFEILNKENIPIDFYVNNLVEQQFYNGNVLMWNPQIEHSAAISKTRRIFFQIELKRNLEYSDYLELYKNGKLINYE